MHQAPFPWFGGKSRAAELIWSRFGDVPNYVEPFAGSLAVLLWGLCMWIGGGWCTEKSCAKNKPEWNARPSLMAELGVHRWRKWPMLQKGGIGVHRRCLPQQMPAVGGDGSGSGRGVHRWEKNGQLLQWFTELAERLRRVRVCCGDWSRVLTRTPTTYVGVTGVLLDPPYSAEAGRHEEIYATEDLDVAHAVRQWAKGNENDPKLRIALCGYDGEHDMPGWECVSWKANGGYGNQSGGRGKANAGRERIWFSPHCLRPGDDLFGEAMTGKYDR